MMIFTDHTLTTSLQKKLRLKRRSKRIGTSPALNKIGDGVDFVDKRPARFMRGVACHVKSGLQSKGKRAPHLAQTFDQRSVPPQGNSTSLQFQSDCVE